MPGITKTNRRGRSRIRPAKNADLVAACLWLARDPDGDIADRGRRAARACDAGLIDGCALEAAVIFDAGAMTTAQRAGELATRICDVEGAPMCEAVVGWFVAGGKPGGGAPVLAAAQRGCDSGARGACVGALLLRHSDTGSGDRASIATEAAGLCAAGVATACDVHGEMLLRGDGTNEDIPAAVAILSERCDANARRACHALRLACRHGIRAACGD